MVYGEDALNLPENDEMRTNPFSPLTIWPVELPLSNHDHGHAFGVLWQVVNDGPLVIDGGNGA